MRRDLYLPAFLVLCSGAVPAQTPPTGAELGRIDYLPAPSGPGSLAPNLSVAPNGVLLSWLEPAADAGARRSRRQARSYALRLARLEGDRWSDAQTIAEGTELMANWADFPSVVAGENGVLLAHWLASSPGEGFVYGIELARSVDDGRSWKRLGSPHGKQRASEYGFVTILPEGEGFRVFWLDGRELGRGGSGKMSLRSCLVGEEVGEQVVLDGDVCTCCQTAATPTSLGPTVVYRDHEEGELRDISIVQLTPEGWSAPRTVHRDSWEIPGCPVNGPAIVSHEGLLAVAWFTRAGHKPRVQVAFSPDHRGEFGAPFTVDDADPLGRVAVIGVGDGIGVGAIVGWLGSDGDQAVFRLRSVSAHGEMGPTIEVGRTERSRASGFPRMVVSGNKIVLAWREFGEPEPAQLRTAVLPLSSLTGIKH